MRLAVDAHLMLAEENADLTNALGIGLPDFSLRSLPAKRGVDPVGVVTRGALASVADHQVQLNPIVGKMHVEVLFLALPGLTYGSLCLCAKPGMSARGWASILFRPSSMARSIVA